MVLTPNAITAMDQWGRRIEFLSVDGEPLAWGNLEPGWTHHSHRSQAYVTGVVASWRVLRDDGTVLFYGDLSIFGLRGFQAVRESDTLTIEGWHTVGILREYCTDA